MACKISIITFHDVTGIQTSIVTHNKISLSTAYNTVQRFDIICVSGTYLDSSVHAKTIEIRACNLVRVDYPINQKRGGVCLYFRKSLCLRQIDSFSWMFFVSD